MLKVAKFGGSSMADAAQIRKVCAIIRADEARKLIVVSAAGKRSKDDHKITDLLYLCYAHIKYGVSCMDVFEQVKQRLEFLKTQVGDLQEARQSLNKVIQEMEKIMAQKFAETYQEVNARFSEVFCSMFGGGQAHLELSDPEDYLLTGIEIVAQPPGKKEQVLTLLSGGERAMTAIALLFSLLTVKPSPFCILDEIESALDDVNIDRFARFIRQYAEKTQFIILSHRKGTMEAADVLYGVTMQEQGISKLLRLDLNQMEQYLGIAG